MQIWWFAIWQLTDRVASSPLMDSFQSKQKVSAHTWKGYSGEELWTGTSGWSSTPVNVFTRPNATTKTPVWRKWQVGQRCERQQVIAEFLSKVKKLHTHLLWEERGKNTQWMHGGGLTLLWRIVRGFVVWKAWEEQGGALTGSLWAGESRINCNCHGCQWGFVRSSRWNGGFEFNS